VTKANNTFETRVN